MTVWLAHSVSKSAALALLTVLSVLLDRLLLLPDRLVATLALLVNLPILQATKSVRIVLLERLTIRAARPSASNALGASTVVTPVPCLVTFVLWERVPMR